MSGPTVVLDTCIFVGAKNPDEAEHESCSQLLELAHAGRFRPLVSAISVAEVCTGYRIEKDDRGRQVFLDYVRSAGVFELRPVEIAVADAASRVRSDTGLRLPDAIVVATGVLEPADFVATHDGAFDKATESLHPITARELVGRLGVPRPARR